MPKMVKQVPVSTAKKVTKKGGSVLDRISDIEFNDTEGISILLYGESGSGKTTVWGTFPGKILSIVCSGGNRTGELRSINTSEHRKKVKTVTLATAAEFIQLMEYLETSGEYATAVLDHVTGFQDLVLSEIIGKPIPEQKSWGMATQQDYGTCSSRCKDGLRRFLNLPINRVIIGQQREFKGDDNSDLVVPTVGIALTPSLAGWLYPACDYVVQTFKRQKTEEVSTKIGKETVVMTKALPGVDYCARVGPHGTFTTKFRLPKERSGELPEYLTDPSYDKIMELING